jgi:RNA-directed DNA polymerase
MIIERMAKELLLPANHIARLAKTASHQYKEYQIAKRGGGTRTILHPSRRLKALQKWLLANVIVSWPVHGAATAYRKGHSIFDNAKIHVKSRFLLRMDMQEFFPSLTVDDMDAYKRKRPTLFKGWTNQDFTWFCFLVFRFDRLTIGAPTSPAVSNSLCFDLDVSLDGICQSHGVTYTRYADDLFFSTSEPGVLADVEKEVKAAVAKLTLPGRLRINDAKTRHSSMKGARRVTGVVLGSDGNAYVGRHLKREIKSRVYKLDSLAPKDRERLAGMISYVTGFDPEFMNTLVRKYGHARAIRARDGKP